MSRLFSQIKNHWSHPPEGRYLSYKEISVFIAGGIGAYSVSVIPTYLTIAVGNYIAVALGIKIEHIMLINIITSILTIIRAPFISMLIDNTNTKYGKFRPYLLWLTIPIMACTMVFGFLPEICNNNSIAILVVYIIVFNLLQFFIAIYALSFSTLVQVMTPNQKEKEGMMSYGVTIYSIGPTIVQGLFPTIANYFYTTGVGNDKIMGVNQIGAYRFILPAFMAVCLLLGVVAALGTKERVIVSQKYKQKVKFMDGVRETSTNKYFWLNNAASSLSVLRLLLMSFTIWISSYLIKVEWFQGMAVTVISFAFTPGMLLAPLLINKFGKRNLVIISNILQMICAIPMILLTTRFGSELVFTPYLLLVLTFFATLFNSIQVVTAPALQTQIFDWQQYKTGKRSEGFITQYQAIIMTLVGLLTMQFQPWLSKKFGYTGTEATALNNPKVLYPIMMYCLVAALISIGLTTIPMLFWDLDEKRHELVIETLKARALQEDDIINEEQLSQLENEIMVNKNKDAIKEFLAENEKIAKITEELNAEEEIII